MKIPFYYNIRNIRVRTSATFLTMSGIAITVGIVVAIGGLLSGLHRVFISNGDPLNVLLLRKGLKTEYSSSVAKESFETVKTLAEVAQNIEGEPMASLEVVTGIVLPRRDGSGDANVTLRGISEPGIYLRPGAKIIEGRWFRAGQREIVAGRAVASRFDINVGSKIVFGRGEWTIVGTFANNGALQESELWASSDQIVGESPRPHFSSILVRVKDESSASQLLQRVGKDPRLLMSGFREPDYYRSQTSAGNSLKFIGIFIATIMAIGSCFAAANAMYSAVSYRVHEVALLRILGFSRRQILGSFVLESGLMALIGGIVGLLILLPFHGFTTGTLNGFTFSEMIFKLEITPLIALIALGVAILMGVIGGIVPAWSASRQEIVAMMRQ